MGLVRGLACLEIIEQSYSFMRSEPAQFTLEFVRTEAVCAERLSKVA